METIITFVAEYAIEVALGGIIVFLNLIGKPKTAEKIKKAKEKTLKKLQKKCIKRVHACQVDEKRMEKIKEELKKNA